MRYPLDICDTVKDSFLFWSRKFIKHKINTLSHSRVTDKNVIKDAIDYLNRAEDIEMTDLGELIRRLRTKASFDGLKTFYIPMKNLYYHMDDDVRSMKDFDTDYIADFLTSSTSGLSDASKINHRNGILNFFNYISKQNETEEGSGNGFIYRLDIGKWQGLSGKSGKKTPDHLTEDELSVLFDALNTYEFSSDRAALFYNLIIRVITYSGIRVSEALEIKREKVSVVVDNGIKFYSFYIKGKGNYNRYIDVRADYIEPYFSVWLETQPMCLQGLLFCAPSNEGKKASASAVSTKIKEMLRYAGLNKHKEGAHLLRHTFGTLVYKETKDLALVQDLLGHNDPNTTRVYTHIDKERMRQASRSFSGIDKTKNK